MKDKGENKDKKPVGRPKVDTEKKADYGFVSESEFDEALKKLMKPLPPKQ
jgi:hypothetical protein